MFYIPEADSHIRDKVKVILDLPNYSAKKEFNNATVDTFNLAAKRNLIALKTEVSKLAINWLMFQLV